MCGDMFWNRDREEELPEDYGEILASQDEHKTNEEAQREYETISIIALVLSICLVLTTAFCILNILDWVVWMAGG